MSATIVQFPGNTYIDELPAATLEKAKEWGMTECIVAGFDEGGVLHFGGSFSDSGKILLLLEAARRQLLETVLA